MGHKYEPIKPLIIDRKTPEELAAIEAERLALKAKQEAEVIAKQQKEAQEKAEFEEWKQLKADQARILKNSRKTDNKHSDNTQATTGSSDIATGEKDSSSYTATAPTSNKLQQSDASSSKRLSISFSASEVDQIADVANQMGLKMATLVRSWTIQKLKTLKEDE